MSGPILDVSKDTVLSAASEVAEAAAQAKKVDVSGNLATLASAYPGSLGAQAATAAGDSFDTYATTLAGSLENFADALHEVANTFEAGDNAAHAAIGQVAALMGEY